MSNVVDFAASTYDVAGSGDNQKYVH